MPSAEEVAWAAGLFEGEGWFTAGRSIGKAGVRRVTGQAGLASTDKDVLDRFARIVGVGRVNPKIPNGYGHKAQWVWMAQSIAEFAYVVNLLGPFLGERRTARMTELCAEIDASRLAREAATRQGKAGPWTLAVSA